MMAVAVRKTQGHVKNRRRGYPVVSANAEVYLDLINDGHLMVSLTVPDYPPPPHSMMMHKHGTIPNPD